jgi:hypothetical protein
MGRFICVCPADFFLGATVSGIKCFEVSAETNLSNYIAVSGGGADAMATFVSSLGYFTAVEYA